jgi:chaperone required for assembly of F1-ATPase
VTGWSARRFWTEVNVRPEGQGFAVLLDARPVRTPLKVPLVLPTEALAREVAAEWQAQTGTVNPATMPFTRTANSAIDSVSRQFDAVAEMLSAYGGSDLLCYRAVDPPALVARQAAGWDPLIDWAASALQAPLHVTAGVMHINQPPASLAALDAAVGGLTAFELSAFHDLVALTGSLVLALAITRGRLGADEAWDLSRIDENWQAELWGQDEEAAETAARKRVDFLQADRFFLLCR